MVSVVNRHTVLRAAGALVVLGALLVSACSPAPRAQSEPTVRPSAIAAQPTTPPPAAQAEPPAGLYVGDRVDPPLELQDFTLPSSTGETMSLSDLNGQWRVMFFGYLHCPDFCPLTLAEYRQVKGLLGEDAEQVEFVYVSVDGVRDTPEALRAYLGNFDPEFIGFSGDDETLARIQPDYGFYYSRRLDSGSQAVYVIDHSTRSYLVDPEGRLRASFTYDVDPPVIASAIQWHMQHQ